MTFKERIDFYKSLTVEQQEKDLLKIVEGHQAGIVDANIAQMMKGKDANGMMLRPYSSKQYAAFKKTLNPLGVTDLHLTGDFQNAMFADTKGWPVKISSTDEKTPDLVHDYSEDIFGLSKESLSETVEELKPDVASYYRSRMVELQ